MVPASGLTMSIRIRLLTDTPYIPIRKAHTLTRISLSDANVMSKTTGGKKHKMNSLSPSQKRTLAPMFSTLDPTAQMWRCFIAS